MLCQQKLKTKKLGRLSQPVSQQMHCQLGQVAVATAPSHQDGDGVLQSSRRLLHCLDRLAVGGGDKGRPATVRHDSQRSSRVCCTCKAILYTAALPRKRANEHRGMKMISHRLRGAAMYLGRSHDGDPAAGFPVI